MDDTTTHSTHVNNAFGQNNFIPNTSEMTSVIINSATFAIDNPEKFKETLSHLPLDYPLPPPGLYLLPLQELANIAVNENKAEAEQKEKEEKEKKAQEASIEKQGSSLLVISGKALVVTTQATQTEGKVTVPLGVQSEPQTSTVNTGTTPPPSPPASQIVVTSTPPEFAGSGFTFSLPTSTDSGLQSGMGPFGLFGPAFQPITTAGTVYSVRSGYTDMTVVMPPSPPLTIVDGHPGGEALNVFPDGSLDFGAGTLPTAPPGSPFTYKFQYPDGHISGDSPTFYFLVTPILLDINGNGSIDLISVKNSSVTIGTLEGSDNPTLIGWVSPLDAILVYDYDQDNNVTHIDEISFISYLAGAKTDLQGLKAFDTNNDDVLDSHDEAFSLFKVWQDSNSDGRVDNGEMQSLTAHGIVSFSLRSDEIISFESDNIIFGNTTYQTQDGQSHLAGDVGFMVDNRNMFAMTYQEIY